MHYDRECAERTTERSEILKRETERSKIQKEQEGEREGHKKRGKQTMHAHANTHSNHTQLRLVPLYVTPLETHKAALLSRIFYKNSLDTAGVSVCV